MTQGPRKWFEVWQQVLQVCPPAIQVKLEQLPHDVIRQVEELRFRLHQPVHLCTGQVDHFLHKDHGLTTDVSEGFVVTAEHVSRIMQIVTQASMYAVQEELRRGFVTMPGGHRVGVSGRVVIGQDGAVQTIRNITSINVRVAKEHVGSADALRSVLQTRDSLALNTLVISPPGCGKTTLLRDLARAWSMGWSPGRASAKKVAVVDERSEIAGCVDGVPQFELGPRTDVLDACPKAEGMLMAIRSLSPHVLVTDEIGRAEDRDAVLEATHAGVAVMASAHAHSLEEWRRRPYMDDLFQAQAFARYVILSRRRGPGTIESVCDSRGVQLPFSRVETADNRAREG